MQREQLQITSLQADETRKAEQHEQQLERDREVNIS